MMGNVEAADIAVEIALCRMLEQSPISRNGNELYCGLLSQVYDACLEENRDRWTEPSPPAVDTIADLLSLLPPRERATLVLASIEGCGYATIAEITKSSEMAVRKDLVQAREKLRLMTVKPIETTTEGEEIDRSAVAK